MLRAGSILYAVFISLVAALLCGFLVMVQYYQLLLVDREKIISSMHTDIRSAVVFLIKHPEAIGYNKQSEIDLFDDSLSRVQVYKEHWGAYDILTAKKKWRKYHAEEAVMIGADSLDEAALYLPNNNLQFSVGPSVVLKGNCYVPGGSIRVSVYNSNSINTDALKSCIKRNSEDHLPVCNKIFMDHDLFIDSILSATDTIHSYYQFISGQDSIVRSFFQPSIVLKEEDNIYIGKMSIRGKVIIRSLKSIEISSDAHLNDVILIAPFIQFKENFKGSVQAFAEDSIRVESSCELLYPTMLCVWGNHSMRLNIEEEAKVAGGLMMIFGGSPGSDLSIIEIKKKASVWGVVFCNAYCDVKGSVIGSLYTSRFISRTAYATNENMIEDAVIDFSSLPKDYKAPLIFPNKGYSIAKWLK